MSQVAVGITLLYCFWQLHLAQTIACRSREVPEAFRACSTALVILAERWVQAEPLRDVFDVLAKAVPLYGTTEEDRSPRRISAESSSYIQSQRPLLMSAIMHRGVLRTMHDQIFLGGLSSHMCSEEYLFFRESTHYGYGWHACSGFFFTLRTGLAVWGLTPTRSCIHFSLVPRNFDFDRSAIFSLYILVIDLA